MASKPRVTRKEQTKLNSVSSGLAGVIEHLRIQLSMLEDEIKADKKGQTDYRRELRKLQLAKGDAQARLDANNKLAETFDVQFGPFMETYDKLTTDISSLYDNAKNEHFKGVQLLVREFSYNPLFKKTGDTFSAVPFKPK